MACMLWHAWHGIGMAWYGTPCHSMQWHTIAVNPRASSSIAFHCLPLPSIAIRPLLSIAVHIAILCHPRHATAWHAHVMVCYGMVWHGIAIDPRASLSIAAHRHPLPSIVVHCRRHCSQLQSIAVHCSPWQSIAISAAVRYRRQSTTISVRDTKKTNKAP